MLTGFRECDPEVGFVRPTPAKREWVGLDAKQFSKSGSNGLNLFLNFEPSGLFKITRSLDLAVRFSKQSQAFPS